MPTADQMYNQNRLSRYKDMDKEDLQEYCLTILEDAPVAHQLQHTLS